jgi:hypothetical protein
VLSAPLIESDLDVTGASRGCPLLIGRVKRRGGERSALSVERSAQVAEWWPRVGCRWQGEVAEVSGAADHGVGAKLTDALGWSMESAPGAQEPGVHPDRCDGADLAAAASFGFEHSVERPVGVSDDVEREPKVLSVGGEAFGGRS